MAYCYLDCITLLLCCYSYDKCVVITGIVGDDVFDRVGYVIFVVVLLLYR